MNGNWLVMLTHICVGPHPSTVSQTGMLRYGQASLAPTGHRMSASPCWLSPTHPKMVTEGEDGYDGKQDRTRTVFGVCSVRETTISKYITLLHLQIYPLDLFCCSCLGQWEQRAKNIHSPLRHSDKSKESK